MLSAHPRWCLLSVTLGLRNGDAEFAQRQSTPQGLRHGSSQRCSQLPATLASPDANRANITVVQVEGDALILRPAAQILQHARTIRHSKHRNTLRGYLPFGGGGVVRKLADALGEGAAEATQPYR